MFANHIAAISLLIAYSAPFISPQNFWIPAFFGLAYPFLVVLNLFFVFYWALQIKKKAFYSLLIVICGFKFLFSTFAINLNTELPKDKKALKVMSYNVKLFDLYNWTRNNKTRNEMFQLINDENPDIVCFQEFYHRDSSEYSNCDSILQRTQLKYAHVLYTSHARFKQHFGIATYSKYPIIRQGKIAFEHKNNNVCIYTDLLINKDTIRVYNMHLQSIAFSKEDYKYAEDLQNNVETKEDVEHSKNILRRLKRAFVYRSQQADLIGAHIRETTIPTIVCGDFNDTPSSYAYHNISNKLNDAFTQSGSGFGRTYLGVFPSFRIDYILFTDDFKSYNFKVIKEDYSDHYPVTCYLTSNK